MITKLKHMPTIWELLTHAEFETDVITILTDFVDANSLTLDAIAELERIAEFVNTYEIKKQVWLWAARARQEKLEERV